MKRDDIIRMALEAGLASGHGVIQITKFAKLIAAASASEEREACAKVCENMSGPIEIYNPAYVHYIGCADAIRARGQG